MFERNMISVVNDGRSRKGKKRKERDEATPEEVAILDPRLGREQRLFLRNRVPVGSNIKGIKKVVLRITGDDEPSIIDISKLKGNSRIEKYESEVLDIFHKVRYDRLVLNERRRKNFDLSKTILSLSIDRERFDKEREGYYIGNKELAITIMDVLDGVRLALERKMKMKFREIEDEVLLPVNGDRDGLIQQLNDKQQGYKLAMSLLGETSMNGYDRMRKSMKGFLTGVALPSLYNIKKKRPALVEHPSCGCCQ